MYAKKTLARQGFISRLSSNALSFGSRGGGLLLPTGCRCELMECARGRCNGYVLTARRRQIYAVLVFCSLAFAVALLTMSGDEHKLLLIQVKGQLREQFLSLFDPTANEGAGFLNSVTNGNSELMGETAWTHLGGASHTMSKTTFWRKSRVVYATGLSETGFSAWRSAVENACRKKHPITGRKIVCKPLCALASSNMWFPENLKEHNTRMLAAKIELAGIKSNVDAYPEHDTVYFLNVFGSMCQTPPHNDMQFPPTQHWKASYVPDLHLLAGVCEEAGVDLRIVTLLKSGDVVLKARSLAEKYTWYQSMGVAKTMETMFNSMFAQLMQISPAFVFGVDMGNPIDLKSLGGKLDDFVSLPGLEHTLKRNVRRFAMSEAKIDAKTLSNNMDPNAKLDSYRFELEVARNQLWARVRPSMVAPSGLTLLTNPGFPKHELGAKKKSTGKKATDEQFSSTFLGVPDAHLKVRKHVFTSASKPRPRMLFFAGLEGTGHHLWRNSVEDLMRNSTYSEMLMPACLVEKVLFQKDNPKTMWSSPVPDKYEKAKRELAKRLANLVEGDAGQGKTYLANLMDQNKECNIKAGMLSYPNFSGRYKTISRPNLVTLAQMCEDAGIDLRVIVLLREGDAVIRSTVDHRHFGGFGVAAETHEIRHLTANVFTLYAQLAALDRTFVGFCFDQEDPTMPGIDMLAETTGIDVFPDVLRKNAHFPETPDEKREHKQEKNSERRNSVLYSLKTTMNNMHLFCPNR